MKQADQVGPSGGRLRVSLIIGLAALPALALVLMLAARMEESMSGDRTAPDLAPAVPWPPDQDPSFPTA
jgi:hypothetical protein